MAPGRDVRLTWPHSKNTNGFEWLLLLYIPDGSSVKDRMIYASTRELLRRQLGTSYFGEEMHGSSAADLTLEAFQHHRESKKKGNADAPLTASEIQASMERGAEVAVGVSKAYVHSVAFPVAQAAQDAMTNFASGKSQLVLLQLHASAESIELNSQSASVAVGALAAQLPANEPRFMLYRFDHQHNNAKATANLFIYSCPGSSPVKQKMTYTTVKGSVTGQCEASGIALVKKLEVHETNEVTEAMLLDELYGPKKEVVQNFDKPKAPGRGAPRLIRKDKP